MALNTGNQRVDAMFSGRPFHEQFLAAALCLAMGKDRVAELADQIAPPEINMNAPVAGRPRHWWMGKTRDQITSELNGDQKAVDEVVASFNDVGLKIAEPAPEAAEPESIPTGTELVTDRNAVASGRPLVGQNAAVVMPGAAVPAGSPPAPEASGEAPEAAIPSDSPSTQIREAQSLADDRAAGGDAATSDNPQFAGYDYNADIRGKSDDQLRAMPNIGARTITRIREFEASRQKP